MIALAELWLAGPADANTGPGAGSAHPVAAKALAKCIEDGEIAEADRGALHKASAAFAEDLLQGRAPEAYRRLNAASRARTPSDRFAVALAQMQRAGPFGELRVEHTYLIESHGAQPSIVCGNPRTLDDWAQVRTSGAARQAYVLYSVRSRGRGWALYVRLEPEDGEWRIVDFALSGSSAAGRTSRDFLALARTQAAAGHAFNTAILLSTAQSLAHRGPDMQWGFMREIQRIAANIQPPEELAGKPPFVWNFGGTAFDIAQVSATDVGQSYVLVLRQQPSAWSGEADADKRNRVLVEAFLASRPEVREVFSAILCQAIRPDGASAVNTLYDMKAGFRDAASPRTP
jgi:hypothetical protein